MRLEGKRTLITGGGTGIGLAIMKRFVEEGAVVAITGRRKEPLEKAAAEVSGVVPVQGDLTSPEGPSAVAESAATALGGGIDILINNAGVFESVSLEETTEETLDRILETNVRGLYRMTRAALSYLLSGDGANIMNIGSILSVIGIRNTSAYAASKGAVAQITRSLAVELGPRGIRCNCICPGLVRTELTDFMVKDEEFVKENLPAYPIGRFGETEDIANACVFLASEEASWITGVILPVDGGYTAC